MTDSKYCQQYFGDGIGDSDSSYWNMYDSERPAYPQGSIDNIIAYHKQYASHQGDSSSIFEHAVDVGCGPGTLMPTLLAPYFTSATLIDKHATQLTVAKERFAHMTSSDDGANKKHSRLQNFKTIQAPAEAMPLPDSSVDLVVSAEAIHWMDWRKFFQEAHRVLKPRGTLAILCYIAALRFIDKQADDLVIDLQNYFFEIGCHSRRKVPLPESCNRLLASSLDELDLKSYGFIHEQRRKFDEWPEFQHAHAEQWDDNCDHQSGTILTKADTHYMQKRFYSAAALLRSLKSFTYFDEAMEVDAQSASPKLPVFLSKIATILEEKQGQPLTAFFPFFEVLGTKE